MKTDSFHILTVSMRAGVFKGCWRWWYWFSPRMDTGRGPYHTAVSNLSKPTL